MSKNTVDIANALLAEKAALEARVKVLGVENLALRESLDAAEEELARLKGQEPSIVIEVKKLNERVTGFNFIGHNDLPAGKHEFYAEPRPAVLPNPKKWQEVEADLTDFGKAVFAGGYNQAIADAIALGSQPQVAPDYFAGLVTSAVEAAQKAMVKFPQPNYVLLKVAEEAGEVVQAGVHYAEGRETWEALEGEVVQTIAMLYRLVTEGDHVNGVIPPKAAGGEIAE